MSDKLKASNWTSFAKKRDLDDAALVKALTKLDGTSDIKPEARLEALAEVIAQITKLIPVLAKRKKELGDKPFDEAKAKLYDILEDAEKLHKALLAAQKAKADAADDEEDSPTLLTTKMIPLLRQLKQPDVRMHALICTAGKNTAVLIMLKPIGMARRKVLSEAVDAKGGAKFIVAECLYENGALVFVVQGSASSLAKRIMAALLAQTNLRLKVRVRGDDGSEDADEEDAAVQPGQATSATPATPAKAAQPSAAQDLWKQRAPRVIAAVQAALKAQHPESTKLRAVVGIASEKAEGNKDYDGALKALDMLVKLLKLAPDTAAGVAATTAAAPSNEPPAKAQAPSSLPPAQVYSQSRQTWLTMLDKARGEIDKLKKAIVVNYKEHPAIKEVAASMPKLDNALKVFGRALPDKLEEAAQATAPEQQRRLHDEVRKALKDYQRIATKEPLLTSLDDNPFVPIAAQKVLLAALTSLAVKLG